MLPGRDSLQFVGVPAAAGLTPASVPPPRTYGARGPRHGASLLEVVFSIGIIAVGLLGVMIIVPLAGMRATQGMITDDADRFGRNIIRLFDTKNMRQPNIWTRFNPNATPTPAYQAYGKAGVGPNNVSYYWRANTNDNWRARSFCIDPLFVAQHVEYANDPNTPQVYGPQKNYFPYYDPTAVAGARMDRVSLRNFPGGQRGMSVSQAYEVFMGQDDLVFDLPDDRTLIPEQKYDASETKRQFMGKYTWMATLTPRFTRYSDDMNIVPETYILSIVVFHRRDMSMELVSSVADEPDNERLVSVNTFSSQGFGGGEVILHTRDNTRPEVDLDLKEGQWLMLAATVNAGTNNQVQVFRWYHVTAVGSIVPDGTTNTFMRNVTLQGSDWNWTTSATQATLLNGVVAVYEKTIRLETSSLWTEL